MQEKRICRTCDCKTTSDLNELSMLIDKKNGKTLSKFLTELTSIDLNVGNSNMLPNFLCGKCTRKLKNAYKFIQQAQQANEKLLEWLKTDKPTQLRGHELKETKSEDEFSYFCLDQPNVKEQQQSIKEISSDMISDIKIEASDLVSVELANTNTSDDFSETIIVQDKINNVAEPVHADPLIMYNTEAIKDLETGGKTDPLLVDRVKNNLNDMDIVYSDDEEEDDVPLVQLKIATQKNINIDLRKHECMHCGKTYKNPRSLRKHLPLHRDKSEWHACTHCGKLFYRKDKLHEHMAKQHGDDLRRKRTEVVSDSKMQKDIDLYRCKPNGCKIIQCMICLRKYSSFAELRAHLQQHTADIISFNERQETLEEILDSFYPDFKNITEKQMITLIRKDLENQRYSTFYSITNEAGYELNLDSSETDSDNDNLNIDDICLKTEGQRIYECELCNIRFQRKYKLYEHQRDQHKWSDAPHECKRCKARFVGLCQLEHHEGTQCNNNKKRFICKKCPMRFNWSHNLKTHAIIHKETSTTVSCSECNQPCDDKRSLTLHMRLFHVDKFKLLPCPWCRRIFYNRSSLVKHLKRHDLEERDLPLAETLVAATTKPNGVKIISCKVCHLQFEQISDLRVHIMMELNLGRGSHESYDSLANYSITNAAGFELHIEDSETDDESNDANSGRYSCELCQVKCQRKYKLLHHQQQLHTFGKLPYECSKCIFKSVSKEVFDHHKRTQCFNTEKQLACTMCGYKFMWQDNLDLHVRIQHASSGEPDTHTDNSPKPLQCPHCERTYKLNAKLNIHIKNVHIDGNKKKKEPAHRYLCALCGLEAKTNSKLIAHMRRHTGEKPFPCDLCDMAFNARHKMVTHRGIHTGERPFCCSICGKNFLRSDKLKLHVLSHSALRPHKCPYCEMDFKYKQNLKDHLRKHGDQSDTLPNN